MEKNFEKYSNKNGTIYHGGCNLNCVKACS